MAKRICTCHCHTGAPCPKCHLVPGKRHRRSLGHLQFDPRTASGDTARLMRDLCLEGVAYRTVLRVLTAIPEPRITLASIKALSQWALVNRCNVNIHRHLKRRATWRAVNGNHYTRRSIQSTVQVLGANGKVASRRLLRTNVQYFTNYNTWIV